MTHHTHTKKASHAVTPQQVFEALSDSAVISDEVKAYWLERFSAVPVEQFAAIRHTLDTAQKELDSAYEAYIAAQTEIATKCEKHLALTAKLCHLDAVQPVPQKKKNYVDEILSDDFLDELSKYDS